MGVALPLALLLALGVGLVVLAHALRKGPAAPIPFPAARLILKHASSAKKQQRIEDRWLLLLRALMVIALTLLAASPFVSCARLSLTRQHGESVAAAIIIDDSASMQAQTKGKSRLQRALDAATQLLDDAQAGDAFSLVLAGAPARILLPSTSDLSSVRAALLSIEPSDRGTDLVGALALARSLQAEVPQQEQPILLLSDMSLTEVGDLDLSGVLIPDIGLLAPLSNCALVQASLSQQTVSVEIICTEPGALSGRTVQLADQEGHRWGAKVPAHDGIINLPLPTHRHSGELEMTTSRAHSLVLSSSASDQILSDDEIVILQANTQLSIAVQADASKAGVRTGSATVIQAGLEALDRSVRVAPLNLLPEEEAGFGDYSALLIDDPSGFPPETRNALENWVKRGGVAVVFLGPAMMRAPLGSNFAPFLISAPTWTPAVTSGTPAEEPGALGPLTATWHDLEAKGRALIATEPDLQILAKWTDGLPLIVSRALGQGLLISCSLPSSVNLSDLVLRPAYLELLDYIVSQANLRLGSAATPVGQRWRVPRGSQVLNEKGQALGPITTPIALSRLGDSKIETDSWLVEPALAGIYQVKISGQSTRKYALRIADEHIAEPRVDLASRSNPSKTTAQSQVELSREMALAVLILGALELLYRLMRREKSPLLGPNLHADPR